MQRACVAAGSLEPCSGPVQEDVSARIDVLRIVLIGLIVFCHGGRFLGSRIPFAGLGVEFVLTVFNRGLACLAVPLFFGISGYLFLRKLQLTPASYVGVLRKKFWSIGVPFLLFNGIWIVWLLGVGSIEQFGSRSYLLHAGIWAKLVGYGNTPLNYPLWFLRDLLKLFALAPLFLLLFWRLPRAGLLGLAILWFVVNPADEYGLWGFAFCFYLGGWLARSRVELSRTAGWDPYVLPAFTVATVLVGLAPWLGLDPVAYAAFKKGYQVLGMAAVWCLSRRPWLRDNGLLHRLAAYSFFIFLTHEPTVSLAQSRLLLAWQPSSSLGQVAAYFLPGLAAVTGLYWLGRGMARFTPRLFALATGLPLRPVRPAGGAKPGKPGKLLSRTGSAAARLAPAQALAKQGREEADCGPC